MGLSRNKLHVGASQGDNLACWCIELLTIAANNNSYRSKLPSCRNFSILGRTLKLLKVRIVQLLRLPKTGVIELGFKFRLYHLNHPLCRLLEYIATIPSSFYRKEGL